MIDTKELGSSVNEPSERQQLVWKGAMLLVCAGIFALVMWSGARETQRCSDGDAAAREACMSNLRAQAPRPPAKGAFSPFSSDAAERRAN